MCLRRSPKAFNPADVVPLCPTPALCSEVMLESDRVDFLSFFSSTWGRTLQVLRVLGLAAEPLAGKSFTVTSPQGTVLAASGSSFTMTHRLDFKVCLDALTRQRSLK